MKKLTDLEISREELLEEQSHCEVDSTTSSSRSTANLEPGPMKSKTCTKASKDGKTVKVTSSKPSSKPKHKKDATISAAKNVPYSYLY